MLRLAANLSFLFTELDFLDRFEAAAEAGFKGVEFLFPYAYPADEIRARLDANGLEMVLFNLAPGHWDKGERGYTAIPGRDDEFAGAVGLALRYAEALGCRRLHAMAGLSTHGADRATYLDRLKLAADWAAPDGVGILIEPINTRDMPGYFLNHTGEAAAVIAETGRANIGLQLDLYHRHIMEGDVAGALRQYAPITRHIQVASPPDRGEPGHGEIDYRPVFEAIDALGYEGWIGCEYKPRRGTREGLSWRERCGAAPS